MAVIKITRAHREKQKRAGPANRALRRVRFDGLELAAIRKASDMSRRALAEAAHVSEIYIRTLETQDDKDPGISVVMSICDALQCDIWDLLTDR